MIERKFHPRYFGIRFMSDRMIEKDVFNDELSVHLPSSFVAHRGPTHLPLMHRILHRRLSPNGPISPGKRISETSVNCCCISISSSSSSSSSDSPSSVCTG